MAAEPTKKRRRLKTGAERFLSLFMNIRAGEGYNAILLALNIFVLLAGYYLLKTVRESLILAENGAAVKAYSSGVQAVLLALLVPLFGNLASRMNRVKLITSVLSFFVVSLLAFFAASRMGLSTGVVFFIWVGIFNVMAVAQFWAFANDLYSEKDGKRLFPVIGIGGSLGAWLGAVAAKPLITQLGPHALMLITAVFLLLCIVLTQLAHRREGRDQDPAKGLAPLEKGDAFRMVLHDRYLLLIAILMIVLNIVNTSGEFLMSRLVVEAAHNAVSSGAANMAQEKWIGAFYADFYSWVNLLSFLLQTFVVYRIFHYIGVAQALYILPAIAFGSYSLIIAMPVLSVVRLFKIAENSVDYSVQSTARQALFLPTSREAKYKAKQAIDSFFMRLGDVLQAGVVYIGTSNGWSIKTFASINLFLVGIWFAVVFALCREYKRRTTEPSGSVEPDLAAPATEAAT